MSVVQFRNGIVHFCGSQVSFDPNVCCECTCKQICVELFGLPNQIFGYRNCDFWPGPIDIRYLYGLDELNGVYLLDFDTMTPDYVHPDGCQQYVLDTIFLTPKPFEYPNDNPILYPGTPLLWICPYARASAIYDPTTCYIRFLLTVSGCRVTSYTSTCPAIEDIPLEPGITPGLDCGFYQCYSFNGIRPASPYCPGGLEPKTCDVVEIPDELIPCGGLGAIGLPPECKAWISGGISYDFGWRLNDCTETEPL